MTAPLQELRLVLTDVEADHAALIEAIFAVQRADDVLARIKPHTHSPGTVRSLIAEARDLIAFALTATER